MSRPTNKHAYMYRCLALSLCELHGFETQTNLLRATGQLGRDGTVLQLSEKRGIFLQEAREASRAERLRTTAVSRNFSGVGCSSRWSRRRHGFVAVGLALGYSVEDISIALSVSRCAMKGGGTHTHEWLQTERVVQTSSKRPSAMNSQLKGVSDIVAVSAALYRARSKLSACGGEGNIGECRGVEHVRPLCKSVTLGRERRSARAVSVLGRCIFRCMLWMYSQKSLLLKAMDRARQGFSCSHVF